MLRKNLSALPPGSCFKCRFSSSVFLSLVLATLLVAVIGVASAQALETTLVSFGSTWSFLDDGNDPGGTWADLGFDDSLWDAGPARLGYGDGNVVTEVEFGSDPDDKHITTYFRSEFQAADPGLYTTLVASIQRDDGAVIYVNGVEIGRSNMPPGPIDALTLAASSVSSSNEETIYEVASVSSPLVAGTNVVAVEIHQRSAGSSDIGLDLQLVASDAGAHVVRGPYLQSTSTDSVVVRWRTLLPADGRLYYGPSPGNLSFFEDGATGTTEHEIGLTGLSPDTRYYYAIATPTETLAGDNSDHFFDTSPPTGTSVDARLWILGDSGTADSSAEAVRDAFRGLAASRKADLLVMLGDNAYDTGTDEEYQQAVFEMYEDELRNTTIWPAFGNHDGGSADSDTQSGPYYDIFTLPRFAEAGGIASLTEAYYSFDFGDVHFVCLDSHDSDRDQGGDMLSWLSADLAATDARWLIAFWHHPPYSHGSHDSDVESKLTEMRENALPILEAAGVDLVLSGHSHSYERSVLLDGHYESSNLLDPSMIVDAGDGDPDGTGAYVKSAFRTGNEGAVYAVAGSSGKTSSAPLDHPIMLISLKELGSLVVDVDDDVLDVRFIDTTGLALDTFRIEKLHVAECGNGVLDSMEDCDDGNTSGGDCCPSDCTFAVPCNEASRASLKITNNVGTEKDRLDWKWARGDGIDTVDFGDPVSGTTYALCVYDEDGKMSAAVSSLDLSSATAWTASGGSGFSYKDATASVAGVRRVKLRAGDARKAKLQFKAKAGAISLPGPLSPSQYFRAQPGLRVQLVSSGDRCWSTTFPAAEISRNEAARFSAKH